jgi:DHA2 family multidrug resistance protein
MNTAVIHAAAQGAAPAEKKTAAPPAPPAPIPFTGRLAIGMLGVLLAAMMSGLNNRVAGLSLVDIRGHLGWGLDQSSWLSTAYSAGELVAMPFTTWFAITFSLRRFLLSMIVAVMTIATILPWVHNLDLLIVLRALHGLFSGSLIPLLMMSALRFLPPPIRLHGLALYALTATFAPNVALWLGARWLDHFEDWRWVYWHIVPLGALAAGLIAWGIPTMPTAFPRFRQANWIGCALGIVGLSLLVVGLDQGTRLDWFNSPLIAKCLGYGALFTALFLLSEWFHPAPFIRLQLLERRNLGVNFSVFFVLLVAMTGAVGLPATALAQLQEFRLAQTAPIGLIVGLPQLILGPMVALLLYQKWVDARYVFATGLLCMAIACWISSGITDEWMVNQLISAEVLQAIGQPMAVISALFLGTSVVQPMEGPFVAGIINTIRAFGTVFGGALISRLMTVRGDFHKEMLLDQLARSPMLHSVHDVGQLGTTIVEQAEVLATADIYRIFAILCLVLIPVTLCLQHIPAPKITSPSAPK